MTTGNALFGAYTAADTYQSAREEGSSRFGAAAKAGVEAALPMMMGLPAYMAYEAVTEGPQLAMSAYDALGTYKRKLGMAQSNQAFTNSHFQDSQQAYTMRQVGQQIAARSKNNSSYAMMGNEAKYMMK